jgi:hypothetical protein
LPVATGRWRRWSALSLLSFLGSLTGTRVARLLPVYAYRNLGSLPFSHATWPNTGRDSHGRVGSAGAKSAFALWAADASAVDADELCGRYRVSAFRTGRRERREHFLYVDFSAGGHETHRLRRGFLRLVFFGLRLTRVGVRRCLITRRFSPVRLVFRPFVGRAVP